MSLVGSGLWQSSHSSHSSIDRPFGTHILFVPPCQGVAQAQVEYMCHRDYQQSKHQHDHQLFRSGSGKRLTTGAAMARLSTSSSGLKLGRLSVFLRRLPVELAETDVLKQLADGVTLTGLGLVGCGNTMDPFAMAMARASFTLPPLCCCNMSAAVAASATNL